MKQQRIANEIISLAMMTITFAIINLFDRWVRQLKLEAGASFNIAPYVSVMTVTKLSAAILLMVLVWWVLIHSRSGWMTGVVYVLAGLTILSLPLLVYVFHFTLPLRSLVTLFPESLLLDASAFVAVMGLVILIKIGWRRWGMQADEV